MSKKICTSDLGIPEDSRTIEVFSSVLYLLDDNINWYERKLGNLRMCLGIYVQYMDCPNLILQ